MADHLLNNGSSTTRPSLEEIAELDRALKQRFDRQFSIQPSLTRSLVSFQANKGRPVYRWYKYKEAFSAALVETLLEQAHVAAGRLLDPFAGSGTALFAASVLGMATDGIELLPIGQQIIETKRLVEDGLAADDIRILGRWAAEPMWRESAQRIPLAELRITKNAYPEPTRDAIERFLGVAQDENDRVRQVLRFALLCVLESISFTRKDGQYLRCDYRSGRKQGEKLFDKGEIQEFTPAITAKINEILADIQPVVDQPSLFSTEVAPGEVRLFDGSCLEVMPKLADHTYDAIITSPPYCNRYDYTRTYALELALLGTGEKEPSSLRQEMLSCTVENRAKDLLKINPCWTQPIAAADRQTLLQAILAYLEDQKARDLLNNNGIPRMVRGYFYEMACVIYECARVLRSGAPLIMVNDNVRYAGASISVDMILSAIAEELGFCIQDILVLPNGKGNSSQQMGEHGREELRKCVYVWRKA